MCYPLPGPSAPSPLFPPVLLPSVLPSASWFGFWILSGHRSFPLSLPTGKKGVRKTLKTGRIELAYTGGYPQWLFRVSILRKSEKIDADRFLRFELLCTQRCSNFTIVPSLLCHCYLAQYLRYRAGRPDFLENHERVVRNLGIEGSEYPKILAESCLMTQRCPVLS